jgi:histidinol-phosphate/aromatic aminotransferase/cobyric acid decarboxylase-like protein/choline kinase
MQALILAAGKGSRMGELTEHCPKCLVKVGGIPIIDRTIDALKFAGITKLNVVVGYKSDILKKHLEQFTDLDISFTENPDYATTNNIYSLWLAKDLLAEDDTILIESDLVFEKNLIKDIVSDNSASLATVAKYEPWMDGTVTKIDEDGNIYDFIGSKDFDIRFVESYYKTVNIYKISKTASEKIIPTLGEAIEKTGKNSYYEEVFGILSKENRFLFRAFDIANTKWYEVDDTQDLDIASTMFAPYGSMLSAYENHYGGYWRYPRVLDFCYLVNPYYPTKALLDKIRYSFDILTASYPSGLREQRSNISRMFGVKEDYTIIGNGAAEIISAIGKVYSGKLTVFVPTFGEYIRCFHKCNIKTIHMINNEFRFDINQILKLIDNTEIITIINPDNPSGSFIERSDMMTILERCKEKNVKAIIDESFCDFAEKNLRYTLITNEIVEKYPNLIVIKSLSKSFGIPGLRLGVAICSDVKTIDRINLELSIWNINSFAEYYLQVVNLQKSGYYESCDKLVTERENFITKLNEIDYLKIYPSQANYILCEVTNARSAREIGELLIYKHDIFIKVLTAKLGFSNRHFIRLAVRNENDNQILFEALKNL